MIRLYIEDLYKEVDRVLKKYYGDYEEKGVYKNHLRYKLNNGRCYYDINGEYKLVDINKNLEPYNIIDDTYSVIANKNEIKEGIVSNKPYFHVLASKIFKLYIDLIQRDMAYNKDILYKDNFGIDDTPLINISIDATEHDIYYTLGINNDIAISELSKLYNDYISIHIEPIMRSQKDMLFRIDDKYLYTIMTYINIYTVRYESMIYKYNVNNRVMQDNTHYEENIIIEDIDNTKPMHFNYNDKKQLEEFLNCISKNNNFCVLHIGEIGNSLSSEYKIVFRNGSSYIASIASIHGTINEKDPEYIRVYNIYNSILKEIMERKHGRREENNI